MCFYRSRTKPRGTKVAARSARRAPRWKARFIGFYRDRPALPPGQGPLAPPLHVGPYVFHALSHRCDFSGCAVLALLHCVDAHPLAGFPLGAESRAGVLELAAGQAQKTQYIGVGDQLSFKDAP